ncbi:hypothetical protein [Paenarthrobacter aurescens]|uniref:hypothetical protein n=1 Tax=Paenarthrobacter aurescens TaxID=43663 RepID=UPI0035E5CF37
MAVDRSLTFASGKPRRSGRAEAAPAETASADSAARPGVVAVAGNGPAVLDQVSALEVAACGGTARFEAVGSTLVAVAGGHGSPPGTLGNPRRIG